MVDLITKSRPVIIALRPMEINNMSLKEQVERDIGMLPETELRQVADYLSFLKYRGRRRRIFVPDDATLAALYAEFGEEDRQLAEEGMEDYAKALAAEDTM